MDRLQGGQAVKAGSDACRNDYRSMDTVVVKGVVSTRAARPQAVSLTAIGSLRYIWPVSETTEAP